MPGTRPSVEPKANLGRQFALALVILIQASGSWSGAKAQTADRARLMAVADRLLNEAQISYVYGGFQTGDPEECARCSACLTAAAPKPSARLKACPVCARCSLDCSHFTALVHKEAGLPYPYLDTTTMLSATGTQLRRSYQLLDLGTEAALAAPGDLLVYEGHVVLLEKRHPEVTGLPRFRGDIVHATGGREIRAPGQGVQRERFIDIETFRGPLRRILRHQRLAEAPSPATTPAAPPLEPAVAAPHAPIAPPAATPPRPAGRLRPVVRRSSPPANDD